MSSRGGGRPARPRPRGAPGGDLRLRRAERLGQDDDPEAADRPAEARPRHGVRARRSRRHRAAGATARATCPSTPTSTTTSRPPSTSTTSAASSATPTATALRAARELLAARRTRAFGGRAAAAVLEGDGAAAGPRAGARQRSRAAVPRRADVGPRPDRPAPGAATSSSTCSGPGKTVFFSTHILADAETLCDRVAVLRGGRLLKVGAPRRDPRARRLARRGPRDRPGRGLAAALAGRRPAPSGWAIACACRCARAGLGARDRRRGGGGRADPVRAARPAVARGLLLQARWAAAPAAAGMGRGMSRVLAVAANTFRETVRERVLYNLVLLRDADDAVRPAARPALDPAGREDHQGHRPRRDGAVRDPDRRLHRGRPGQQGDRAPLALPAAGEAALPRTSSSSASSSAWRSRCSSTSP